MISWKAIPFLTALLVAQAASTTPSPNPNQTPPPQSQSAPLYQVTVVQGSAKAINYRNLKRSTEIDLMGTILVAHATGEAKVKSEDSGIQISVKVKHLPPPSSFGGEFMTYVLWGVSPEGRPTNLGELILDHGKGSVKVMEKLQTFGLVITAEPYFAVTRPSDVVVMENVMRQGSKEQFEFIDAKYELLKRGQYTLNLETLPVVAVDAKTPFDLLQARNAVRIARASGAMTYSPEAFGKAANFLAEAETSGSPLKTRTIAAREAVQRAEDARLIAVEKQDAERVSNERRLAQDKLNDAKREAAQANAAEDRALQQKRATAQENADLRSKNEGLETKNEGLHHRLMVELNAVLQTRATARGLIVNMSGVLFQNGQATLLPAAREKLAKVAGILSTHKGLKIEAEGHTDSNGSDASNQRLSEKRADNTREYLIQQGVLATSITSRGFGEGSPIASNATNAGRQENRRVELVVSGAGLSANPTVSLK